MSHKQGVVVRNVRRSFTLEMFITYDICKYSVLLLIHQRHENDLFMD